MYRAVSVVALPLASFYLMWRSRRQPAYRRFWNERFAWAPFPRKTDKPRVWIHAVSVGETHAAKPLVSAMLERWPDADILLTHMTPTGREAGAALVKLSPGRIHQCYLPYDAPYAVEKFFRQTRPNLGVIMETEVWPNVMREAGRVGVPMVLANARESEKSLQKANRFIDVLRPAFAQFSAILAQSEADKERLEQLGGQNITVTGSLKFDITPNRSQYAAAQTWKALWTRPVVLFASTRAGEEAMFAPLIKAYKAQLGNPLFLVVPRHPERFDEVATLLKETGLSVVRRSEITEAQAVTVDTDVLLGDSMGEMSFYCALSDQVVMGGSFGPYGSQNVIEPAMAGSPVIVGPSTFNFEQIIADGVEAGAMQRVAGPEDAMKALLAWHTSPETCAEASDKAIAFSSAYRGATARIMETLEALWKTGQKREFPTS